MSRPDLTPVVEIPVGQTMRGLMQAQETMPNVVTPKMINDRRKTDWSQEYGEFSDDELGGEW